MPPHLSRDELLASLIEELHGTAADEASAQEAIYRRHPECEEELRQLWATFQFANVAATPARPAGSLSRGSAAFPTLPMLPCRMGDYELQSELGRGGMGIVYRAWQISLDRPVALKMILRGDLASTQDLLRFRAEAQAIARLDHPNIIRILDAGELDGQPFFTMPLIEGETLAARLSEGFLSNSQAAALMIPVCRAIAGAHRSGFLHRDLKPSNIIIDRAGNPHVSDFGLAKRVLSAEHESGISSRGANPAVSHSGAMIGTPGYMAPEQLVGDPQEVTAAADVYGLGAILYAALTGRPPYQPSSAAQAVMLTLEHDPPAPNLLNPRVDPDLELIVLKALQKPADLRYVSADALADDLQAWLSGDPLSVRSSRFSDILNRVFREKRHATVLQNWGLLWIWHSLALLVLCLITNVFQLFQITSRWPYVSLWTIGLGTWAIIFWNLRHRAGPVTFVERQIAHIWAASMAGSTLLFAVEALLELPVLFLSPALPILAGSVFVAKAGILSGEFYIHAGVLYLTALLMPLVPKWGISLFGLVSALTFLIPGWKFHRQRSDRNKRHTDPFGT